MTINWKVGIPRTYIHEENLDAAAQVQQAAIIPKSIACVRYCERFLTYPVMDNMGMFNGLRIIPRGAMCPNLPGQKCLADNVVLDSGVIWPRLWDRYVAVKDHLKDIQVIQGSERENEKRQGLESYLRDLQKTTNR